MSEAVYVELLSLTSGIVLLTAVLVLWRRSWPRSSACSRCRASRSPGWSAVVAVHEGSAELGVCRRRVSWRCAPGCCPGCCAAPCRGRAAPAGDPAAGQRGRLPAGRGRADPAGATRSPQPLVALAPHRPRTRSRSAMAVVLIGFFVLVTRRRALSQLVGFLLMDNGITAVGFLTTAGIGLVVELGVSLDVLLAVLVLQMLTDPHAGSVRRHRPRRAAGAARLMTPPCC